MSLFWHQVVEVDRFSNDGGKNPSSDPFLILD